MNLLLMREKANLTQQALAERVGVTRQMISAIENGASPSVGTAKKIAKALDFNWTRFYEDEDQAQPPVQATL